MRGYVHPEWVPRYVAIHYLLLGHLFKVRIPVWFMPGVFATLKPRLLSGDAFSVLAIRIRRLSIRNIFQNNFYILQFEYPSHWCISSYCVFLKQTTVLFFLTQTSLHRLSRACSHHPDGQLFYVLCSLYSVLKVKCSALTALLKKSGCAICFAVAHPLSQLRYRIILFAYFITNLPLTI